MSSNRSRVDGPSGVPHDPEQADLDSMAARSAGGESGSEGIGGAPPSNTAPHNSISTLPDGFRLLRLAVDSLYLSYPSNLEPATLSALNKLKAYAQSDHLEELAKAQYPIGMPWQQAVALPR